MNNIVLKLSYVIIMITIVVLLVFIDDMKDSLQMILGAAAVILTSIFTYSVKDEIPYRRNKKDDTV